MLDENGLLPDRYTREVQRNNWQRSNQPDKSG